MSEDALRKLLIQLGYDMDEKSEKAVLGSIEGIKKAALGLGAALGLKKLVGWIEETVEGVAESNDKLGDMAEMLGVDAAELQVLGKIADRSNSSIDEMAVSMKFLSKNMHAARSGGKGAVSSFKEVGVSLTGTDGKAKSVTDLMVEMADKFRAMKDPTARTALALKLFGKAGLSMVPMMMKGSDELKKMVAKFKEAGTITKEDIDNADAWEQATIDKKDAIKGLKKAFAKDLIPLLTLSIRSTTEFLKAMKPFAKAVGKGLAEAIKAVNFALRGMLSLLRPITALFKGAGDTMKASSFAADAIKVALLGIGVAAAAVAAVVVGKSAIMAAAWLFANFPLVLTAVLIAAIIVAIGLLVEDLIKMGEGADSVSGTMIQGFQDLVAELGSIPAAIWQMLQWAIEYWARFFGMSSEKAKAFAADLVDILKHPLDYFFAWLESTFANVLDWIGSAGGKAIDAVLRPLRSVGQFLGVGGGGNIAGVNTAGAMAAPPTGGGVVNAGGNSVQVNATVTGVSTPDQVGTAIATHVSSAFEAELMRANQSFAYGAP